MPRCVSPSGTGTAVFSSQFHAATAMRSPAMRRAGNNVLAAGEPRGDHSPRALEELMLRAAGDHSAAVEHQQVSAEPKGFFHIVRYKDDGAAVIGQRFAKLFFHLAAQVRIKSRKGLIEQQRIRLNGQAPRNGRTADAGRRRSQRDSGPASSAMRMRSSCELNACPAAPIAADH
jgi:hypothetical protein